MKNKILCRLALVSFLMFCACSQDGTKTATGSNPEADHLNAIVQRYADTMKRLDPYHATYFNIEEDLGQFGDYPSHAMIDRAKQNVQRALEDLKTVDFAALAAKDQRTYRLFKGDMEVGIREFDFPGEYLELNQMGNRLHSYMDSSNEALTSFPFDSVKHYDDYLKRSEGFPAYVDRQIKMLREGLRKKIVLSCIVAKKVPNTYKDALETEVEKNPFYRPVGFMPKTFPEADRNRITRGFHQMVSERIIPGYQKFDRFYRQEYLPRCRQGFGLASLPNGDAWYRQEIKASTGLDLNPQEIHQIGLREVARISAEMSAVKKELGFKGTDREFLHSLSKDQRYFYKTAPEMMAAFERVKIEVAAKIPQYFSLLPKEDFKFVESSNPEDAAGSYDGPTESKPFGRFVSKTADPRAVPIYETTTLLMHETVPGHHLQIALSFDMKDELSEYQRKMFDSTAFVEGWALYAEYLGREMGMYKDPLQRLGNLNDEMLRAVRLVVDTGIHSMGWSQKKAIDFASRHMASEPEQIETEINRYSVWPGQALGYKIGQLKILELRHKAEQALGQAFDIKGFHKAVIGQGTVSLPVLETQVNDWIQQVQAARTN